MTGESGPPSKPERPAPKRAFRRALFALGLAQLRARPSVVLGAVFYVLVVVGVAAVGGALAWRGREIAARVPALAAEIFAWGPGMLVAFGAALHAFRNDSSDGILLLLRGRGVRLSTWVSHRALALSTVLAVLGGGGVIVVTAACAVASPDPTLARAAMAAGVGALFHALGFAVMMSPVVLAALGGVSRGAGYLALVAALVGPEVARLFATDVPPEWRELLSIPSCLAALATSTTPGHFALVPTLGALFVVAAVTTAATALAVRVAARAAAPKPDARPFDRALRGEAHNA